MKIDPREMYKNNPEYTQFDEDGIPTHDKKGVEILKVKNLKIQSNNLLFLCN